MSSPGSKTIKIMKAYVHSDTRQKVGNVILVSGWRARTISFVSSARQLAQVSEVRLIVACRSGVMLFGNSGHEEEECGPCWNDMQGNWIPAL